MHTILTKINCFIKVFMLSLILSGCASIKRIEDKSDASTAKITAMQTQLETVLKAIDDLNINQGGATNSMRADLTILIKQLETQLELMKAEMDEFQYRFRQLEKKMDALANQRLQVTTVIHDSTDSTAAQQTSKVITGLDVEKLYNQAREDFISGKYDIAYNGFQTVLEKAKSGLYKDNALYWMGECFYRKNNFPKAIEYYTRSVTEYPRGNKICSAYYKMGMSAEKGNMKVKRDEYWKTLIEKCPSSNEAKKAQDQLK